MGHGVEGRNRPSAPLDSQAAAQVASTLQALATPSRLMILTQLRNGPLPVTDLAEAIGMEQSAVSHQLRVLRNLGLVGATGQAVASSTASTTRMWRSFLTKPFTTASTCTLVSPTGTPARDKRSGS
ncbi:ArsR family transcriptional regulator [Mycobacterium tuberculosis]|nr:ArsR family transcriptional regulator [Mycobacterium tuberculosis]